MKVLRIFFYFHFNKMFLKINLHSRSTSIVISVLVGVARVVDEVR